MRFLRRRSAASLGAALQAEEIAIRQFRVRSSVRGLPLEGSRPGLKQMRSVGLVNLFHS